MRQCFWPCRSGGALDGPLRFVFAEFSFFITVTVVRVCRSVICVEVLSFVHRSAPLVASA